MMRPSTVGDEPTRGGAPGTGGPKKNPRKGGLIFSAAAIAAPTSLDHSIFCSEAMSLGWSPSSFITWRAYSLDCSALGKLPPPPDCTEARWNSPAADGMPIRHVTLEPPPDWP